MELSWHFGNQLSKMDYFLVTDGKYLRREILSLIMKSAPLLLTDSTDLARSFS